MASLRELSEALRRGETSSVKLARQALALAKKSESVFIRLNPDLIDAAKAIDQLRNWGESLPALAGIPITLKDLFDLRDQVTLAGSKVLKRVALPAQDDADVIIPLRNSRMLFVGRTNMSEFAFSGVGKNIHYGTPLSIWDRKTGHIPGGSSSGSAVSVAEGIVVASLGSDTAGSCRVPAAFNGIVGAKPSYGRMSLRGIYPLSPSSDAPGPLARDVDSCYILDQLMSGEISSGDALPELPLREPGSLKLVVPEAQVLDDLDAEVKMSFELAVDRLKQAGAEVSSVKMPVIDDCIELFHSKAIVVYEVYQHLQDLLQQYGDEFDPLVYQRMSAGSGISDDDQQARYSAKARVVDQFGQDFKQLNADALIYPTAACIPPTISETEDLENAARVNLRCLRNTATANYFDGCSISLPCHARGDAPVGLMVSSMHGEDRNLYAVSAAIESVLKPSTS